MTTGDDSACPGGADTCTCVLVPADELMTELATAGPCPDCVGGLGVLVETNGDWHVIQVHTPPCVAMARAS